MNNQPMTDQEIENRVKDVLRGVKTIKEVSQALAADMARHPSNRARIMAHIEAISKQQGNKSLITWFKWFDLLGTDKVDPRLLTQRKSAAFNIACTLDKDVQVELLENPVRLLLWRPETQTYDHMLGDFWDMKLSLIHQAVNTKTGKLRGDEGQRLYLEAARLKKARRTPKVLLVLDDVSDLTEGQIMEALDKVVVGLPSDQLLAASDRLIEKAKQKKKEERKRAKA